MKFDMWKLAGLVDVLIKCRCCNISGTWFVILVILVIAGYSEYVIGIQIKQTVAEKCFIILT